MCGQGYSTKILGLSEFMLVTIDYEILMVLKVLKHLFSHHPCVMFIQTFSVSQMFRFSLKHVSMHRSLHCLFSELLPLVARDNQSRERQI